MRALVTGAAGFVGRRFCSYLSSRRWEVVGSDFWGTNPPPECCDWLRCDITSDTETAGLLKQAGALTHVFHLAALTFVPDSARDPAATFEVNVEGTTHIARGIMTHTPAARLILISSADIYGPPRFLPITETHPLQPGNPYAQSKEKAEEYCNRLSAAGRLDLVTLRPFNHTGPGQSEKFVLPSFARQIARIEAGAQPPVMRVGNLDAARDFSHVDDVIRAYELAALRGAAGETYNVCSGASVRVGDALERLRGMSQVEITVETDPARVRPVEVTEVRGSYEKLAAATGWRPEISFDRLLEDLLEYWRGRVR